MTSERVLQVVDTWNISVELLSTYVTNLQKPDRKLSATRHRIFPTTIAQCPLIQAGRQGLSPGKTRDAQRSRSCESPHSGRLPSRGEGTGLLKSSHFCGSWRDGDVSYIHITSESSSSHMAFKVWQSFLRPMCESTCYWSFTCWRWCQHPVAINWSLDMWGFPTTVDTVPLVNIAVLGKAGAGLAVGYNIREISVKDEYRGIRYAGEEQNMPLWGGCRLLPFLCSIGDAFFIRYLSSIDGNNSVIVREKMSHLRRNETCVSRVNILIHWRNFFVRRLQ